MDPIGAAIVGLPFAAVVVLSLMAAHLRLLRGRRAEVLLAASVGFVALLSPMPDALCLAIMAATGLGVTAVLQRRPAGWLLGAGIALVITEFLAARQVLPWTVLGVGPTIGLSYLMFRLIHMMVDAQTGELPPEIRLRDRVCFLFCYLTFLAGPVARVQEFAAELARPARGGLREALTDHGPEIVSGYLKATVLAGAAMACFGWSQGTALAAPVRYAAEWAAFAAYLYFSFAGYSQVVRGIGGLSGLELPENFDRPWAAPNFLELWSRWHISLSEWFKLYMFNPVVKALIGRFGKPALIPYLGATGYFLTFFLMGLWHGISLRFALYGLVLGAGVSVNKLYQAVMLKRLGRKRLNEVIRRPAYIALSRGLAVSFFILALGFLWMPPGESGLADRAVGAALLTASVLVLSFLLPPLSRLGAWPPETRVVWMIEAVAVVVYLGAGGPVPPLIYVFF
jgi:D-alanyl-lipoteichoic acid acyltransferase DltB (MBOAT superfamily)